MKETSFNSRTREGCDPDKSLLADLDLVSIHAPARGAIPYHKKLVRKYKFQFTHPRGVRFGVTASRKRRACFNSRTREGCDPA